MGERSNFALLPVVIAALEQLLDWRVERIAASLSALNARIAERLAASGFVLLPSEVRSPHILGVAVPPGATDIITRLAAQQIHISQRGAMLRISPHLHISDHDIDRLCDALHAIGQGQ
jgi:selenocysteine lyase/cysteine desulfurase